MEKTNTEQSIVPIQEFLPKKVGIIYSEVKREYFPTESQYITEKSAKEDALVIASYISKMGVEAKIYPGDSSLHEELKKDKPEMVFNLVDSIKGNEYLSSAIPGILEMLEVPYTGADILGLALCFNKFLVKKLLQQAGVAVPNFQLFNTPNDPLDINLRFPLISKLNEIHGAVEITKDSVSENEKHLRDRIKYLMDTYKQTVLVEEFIVGREITSYVLEGLNRKIYLAEKVFNESQEKYNFVTFEDQWTEEGSLHQRFHYEKVEDTVLKESVRKAFDCTKMMDYGKFDIRVDSSGRNYFVDANANPAFGPKELETAMSAVIEGIYNIPFTEILRRLMLNTLKYPPSDFNSN